MSEHDVGHSKSSLSQKHSIPEGQPERVWEQGWQGHKDAQLFRMASLSLEEKLEWLEDAHNLVLALSADGKKQL